MTQPTDSNITPNRREFIKASSLAVAGTIAMPYISRAQGSPNSTLKVGLVGCGGRGTGAASQALHADKNVILTAVADAFSEKAESAIARPVRRTDADQRAIGSVPFAGDGTTERIAEGNAQIVEKILRVVGQLGAGAALLASFEPNERSLAAPSSLVG